ncbi:YqaE/Pmp3 family membrane protein [Bizionia gelidisalsuginis]|uniref:YqaE/Pmp3 family membrane protein n=2 Tax=Bizionia TaxID=283785 RepID=A0A8H2QJX0_9FLAO|nr:MULTISPECIES: YqaE/Pmp3 family membrane protein [Bizionia]TYB76708.1 YqaE/Pmp3 family membrane protein [Bizionia saleffrena]TYC14095.1 YqaE/Pmp3 family membrane protein [Bizionia gelidisalsuginis]
MSVLNIIITILLPPLGVFLKHGLGGKFLINILLTLLGWLPGVIHAFYVNQD